MAVLSQLSCRNHSAAAVLLTVLQGLFCLRCLAPWCPVLFVLSRLLYSGCPVPAILLRLSCSGCPIPAITSWLSCFCYPVLAVLFSLSWLAALFPISCPDCSMPAVLCCVVLCDYLEIAVLPKLIRRKVAEEKQLSSGDLFGSIHIQIDPVQIWIVNQRNTDPEHWMAGQSGQYRQIW